MGSNSQNDQIYRSDLDLMTLVLKLDLDMVKYHHTKNEVSMLRHSKVIACTDTQTDTHTQYENITFPHTRVVKIYNCHTLFLKFTEAKNYVYKTFYTSIKIILNQFILSNKFQDFLVTFSYLVYVDKSKMFPIAPDIVTPHNKCLNYNI